jgi:hypothetical protein
MIQSTYVADHSPLFFLESLLHKISDGFYADTSVQGYPYFGTINEVKLFRHPKPEVRNDLSGMNEVYIQHYDNTLFILDIQDAALQGFDVVPGPYLSFNTPHGPHQVHMKRVKRVSLSEASQSVADTEPVRVDTQEPAIASQELTEAPVATKPQRGRPAKSKQA